MITMNVLGKIRRLKHREGLSISEISRRTGLARNTVKRWLKAERGTQPRYRRKASPTLLSAFEVDLRAWLEADARRPKRDRRSALALFKQLRKAGFRGSLCAGLSAEARSRPQLRESSRVGDSART